MKKFKGKYIREWEIKKAKKTKGKTLLGNPRIQVSFVQPEQNEEGDSPIRHIEKREYPLAMLELMVTDEASDATSLRDRRTQHVVEKVLGFLAEAELNIREIDHAMGPLLQSSIQKNVEVANEKHWGKPSDSVTLKDVDDVMKS